MPSSVLDIKVPYGQALVVDDDPDFLSQMTSRLSALGINITTCSTFAQASELIKQRASDFGAIIVDVDLV